MMMLSRSAMRSSLLRSARSAQAPMSQDSADLKNGKFVWSSISASARATQPLRSYSSFDDFKRLQSSIFGSRPAEALRNFYSLANLKLESLRVKAWKPKFPNSPRGLDWVMVIFATGTYIFGNDTVPVSGRSHIVMIPSQLENLLGNTQISVMDIDPLPLDTPHIMRIARILDKLCSTPSFQSRIGRTPTLIAVSNETFKLKVYGETFILGGIQSGVEDAEYASAISHELGHMMARHSSESYSRSFLIDGFRFYLLMRGFLSGFIPFLVHAGCFYLVLFADRLAEDFVKFRTESEANLIARKLMEEAYYEVGPGAGGGACSFSDRGFWAKFWLRKFMQLKMKIKEDVPTVPGITPTESGSDERAVDLVEAPGA